MFCTGNVFVPLGWGFSPSSFGVTIHPLYDRRGSTFWDIAVSTLWLSMVRKQLMYWRISFSFFGEGGSNTVRAERNEMIR